MGMFNNRCKVPLGCHLSMLSHLHAPLQNDYRKAALLGGQVLHVCM